MSLPSATWGLISKECSVNLNHPCSQDGTTSQRGVDTSNLLVRLQSRCKHLPWVPLHMHLGGCWSSSRGQHGRGLEEEEGPQQFSKLIKRVQ